MAKRRPNHRKSTGERSDKKAYKPPVLTEYGSVAKLTRTTLSGGLGDGGVHPSNMRN